MNNLITKDIIIQLTELPKIILTKDCKSNDTESII